MYGRFTFFILLLGVSGPLTADPPDGETKDQQAGAEESENAQSTFVLTDEVRDVLVPLFSSIANADVSRATIEMLADSLVNGKVVESQVASYQIASRSPDKFTIYLKQADQRTRIYCNGKSMTAAVAPDAYFRIPEPISTQDAVQDLPVPLGPYPEPVLALTLAGVDPAISFVGGMKSLEVVDRKDFRGKIPSIHLRGVQDDAVTWDFWIAKDKSKPLRLLVDLTPMLIGSDQLQVPENYSYQVRFDFLSWRVSGDVDEKLFTYTPAKDAKEFKSLQDYYESIAGAVDEHPLLGKLAPSFAATTLGGKKINSKDLKGKVVVLDFWATWCTPCHAVIPVLKEVSDKFDKDVVFLALNTGEKKEEVEEFLKQQQWDINVLLDSDGEVADAYAADAIPQTVVIGQSGMIESVHIGFLGAEALKQRLTDELEVLTVGGKIASADAETGK